MNKENKRKYGLLSVGKNLQLFAEGDSDSTSTDNTQGTERENYTKEEYESLKSQLQKIKDSNDKLSSELAQKKRAEREKLSLEEQEAEARKEKEAEYEQMKEELNSIKIRAELNNCGIEEKEMNSLVETIKGGDSIEISKKIASIIKAQVDKKEKEMKLQNQHTQHYPQPSSKETHKMSSFMENRIASRKKIQ